MSYISAVRKRDRNDDTVVVWERDGDVRKTKFFKTRDYLYFYIEDEGGEYTSIFGKPLRKLTFNNTTEFHNIREELKNEGYRIYESDIPPEIKVLSSNYYEKPAPKLNITYWDIEVDYDKDIGHANMDNPYAPINAVSLYHEYSNRLVSIVVPPPGQKHWFNKAELIKEINKEVAIPPEYNFEIYICENEMELLLMFLEEIQDSDGIAGFNSEFFDTPYMCKRIELILGDVFLKKMSFEGAPKPQPREVEKFGKTNIGVDIYGRLDIDYLELFKKYEMENRPSYKLEILADEVLVDDNDKPILPKLEYEGSLHDLYRKNFPFFIRYNIRDAEILFAFEKKQGYVKLANDMCHISTGLYKYVTGTIKLSDLATINYCHYKFDVKVPDFMEKPSRKIKGAYVLYPRTGMHDWIGSIDINSLYPSSIRSLNISPEMIRGQFIEEVQASEEIAKNSEKELTLIYEDGSENVTLPASAWREQFIKNSWAVSGFGTVFDQSKKGIIPTILEEWYAKRKEYKKKSKEAYSKGNKELGDYFDRLQYVFKIKLNSYYGAFSNEYFRFYDLRMGESTTGTGRMILKHQCRKVAEILEGKYSVDFPLYYSESDAIEMGESPDTALHGPKFQGTYQSNVVISGDTDSTYFTIPANNKEDAIRIAEETADKVNKSFPEFMRKTFLCVKGFDDKIASAREMVASRGLFIEKKRYLLRIVDIEGKSVDKLKIMGVEIKKTVIPKPIKIKLTGFMRRLLIGEKWDHIAKDIVQYKNEMTKPENLMQIGLPKGVKKVEHYTNEYNIYGNKARLPGHVAASILWNLCLKKYNDKESPKIMSGMKIKVFYLTKKIGKFKSIAVPVDIENIPAWFKEDFVPIIDVSSQIEKNIDKPLDNMLKAINIKSPSEQSLFVDSLLEF